MMKVKVLRNLGKGLCDQLGLDLKKMTEGNEVDLNKEQAELLSGKNLVQFAEQKAVPPRPSLQTSKDAKDAKDEKKS